MDVETLNEWVARFETPDFIATDPISLPHAFDDPRDQEIMGLFAALLAWGQRKTTIQKLGDLAERMQFKPAQFVYDFHETRHAAALHGFKHRTFNSEDAIALVRALSWMLRQYGSLETAFSRHLAPQDTEVYAALQGFSTEAMTCVSHTPARLQKHLARPATGSACKRLNMYLRWMVRQGPVDLGIWKSIRPAQLILPLDIHAGRNARALGFLTREKDDWRAAMELTSACRRLDPEDPCKYDFAFFGLGVTKTQF